MKKKLLMAVVVSMIAAMMFGGVASAHVHGVTPLAQITVDDANSGGNGTNGTPADDANGGPIIGLIPRDTGNSPLTGGPGSGGFGATGDNAP